MQSVDWIILVILIIAALLGLLLGFGKLLKIFTGGIVGIAISIVVVYFCIGVVGSWGFVQDLMSKLHGVMEGADNVFLNWLLGIGIEKIILGIILFIAVQIIRIILVNVIKSVAEINNVVIKAINKFFGMVFMLAIVCMLTLIVFQIVAWVGGNSAESFRNSVTGAFRLEWVFDNNPLNSLFAKIEAPQ